MHIPVISDIFGYLFEFLYNITQHQYLIALFLFALIIKLILFPFGIKQQKNSIKQARLRPKEMAIRNKYKGRTDKATQQKQSEEIMKLYQEENVNPMGGCLPLLIQMPVLFALYDVIRNPMTYILRMKEDVVLGIAKAINNAEIAVIKADTTKTAEEIAKLVKKLDPEKLSFKTINQIDLIKDIPENIDAVSELVPDVSKINELIDSFHLFGFDLTVIPSEKWGIYILIPVLTFLFSFISTKIIRKFTYQPQPQNQDSSSKASMVMMDFMMPLMSVWIATIVSSAIGIYWMFQNILSVVQQIILYKLFPIPAVTDEQIKEAELQLKGKTKNNKNKPVVLDNNDIDDYDKTVVTDKSGSNKNDKKKKDDGVLSSKKAGISPKVKERIKETGRPLKARRKI